MTVRLSKLHGTGNDFLVTVARDGASGAQEEFARAVCDRHHGIGADGFITLRPGNDGADCTMELRNADGGLAEMSGNGIRCLAWVAVREGLGSSGTLIVETGGGRRTMSLVVEDGELRSATVDMGPVSFDPAAIPLAAPSAFDLEATFHGTTYRGDAAGMGNPHLVLLVDDVDVARVVQHGPHLEVDERFPKRTNVEFVAPNTRGGIDMRVWERGVGETLSCGTGACAAAAVAHRRGLVGRETAVRVPGGELSVTLGDTVLLGGPVAHVFDTEVDEQALVGGGE